MNAIPIPPNTNPYVVAIETAIANKRKAEAHLSELQAKHNELVAEHNNLLDKKNLTDGERERLENLRKGVERLAAEIREAYEAVEARQKELNQAGWEATVNGAVALLPGVGGGTEPMVYGRSGYLSPRSTDPARWVIEKAFRQGLVDAKRAEMAEMLVLKSTGPGRQLASEWVQVTGQPAYHSAFLKLLADPQKGHMLWTDAERAAYQQVKEWSTRFKAMSTGVGEGGEMIPLTLDPAIMLASGGSTNPLRRVARQVITATNAWQGVTSEGVTAEWKTEGAEANEATPTLAEVSIDVHFGSAFVPYSFEVGDDARDFGREIAKLLLDAADQLQAEAFVTGSGTGEPKGIITALDGSASEVTPTTGETFAAADVYKVQNNLPARFQARAVWLAALPTINYMAQFETTNGARLFPELGEGSLLRRPVYECSNMRSVEDINEGKTEDNHILLYGDFEHFVIVDRIGSQLEIIPHLFGSHQRPTGQRGAFLWFRCGSNVTVANAFRVLNVATSGS